MHLGMRLEQNMILECTACGEPMSDHASDCPQGQIEALFYSIPRGRCPACRKNDLFPNAADYFECRGCRVQFSVGLVCGGEDPDTLETKFLDLAPGYVDLVQAKQLKTPGTGNIPVLEKCARLHAHVKAARVSRRAAERTQKRIYELVLKRELEKIEKKKEGDAR